MVCTLAHTFDADFVKLQRKLLKLRWSSTNTGDCMWRSKHATLPRRHSALIVICHHCARCVDSSVQAEKCDANLQSLCKNHGSNSGKPTTLACTIFSLQKSFFRLMPVRWVKNGKNLKPTEFAFFLQFLAPSYRFTRQKWQDCTWTTFGK